MRWMGDVGMGGWNGQWVDEGRKDHIKKRNGSRREMDN